VLCCCLKLFWFAQTKMNQQQDYKTPSTESNALSSFLSIISNCFSAICITTLTILGLVLVVSYPDAYVDGSDKAVNCKGLTIRYVVIALIVSYFAKLLYIGTTIILQCTSFTCTVCVDASASAYLNICQTIAGFIACLPLLLGACVEWGLTIALTVFVATGSSCAALSAPFLKIAIAYVVLQWCCLCFNMCVALVTAGVACVMGIKTML